MLNAETKQLVQCQYWNYGELINKNKIKNILTLKEYIIINSNKLNLYGI